MTTNRKTAHWTHTRQGHRITKREIKEQLKEAEQAAGGKK